MKSSNEHSKKSWLPASSSAHSASDESVVLETDRLLLRKPCEEDAASIFAYASNENVSRYTRWRAHRDLEDSKKFIQESQEIFERDYWVGPFVILMQREPTKVIGTIGCADAAKEHKRMEMGLAISEAHWGKGIATEASKRMIDYAFSNFDLERMQYRCVPENEASLQLAKKLGFQYEGRLRHVAWSNGRHWDIIYLSMLRGEWEAAQQ
ncbi:MAG: GNAT family protein [Bacteroidota bacterium]